MCNDWRCRKETTKFSLAVRRGARLATLDFLMALRDSKSITCVLKHTYGGGGSVYKA